jgi:hypothetical protein
MGIVFEINIYPVFLNRPKLKLITDKRGNKIDGEIVDLTEADPQTDRYRRTIIKSLDPKQYSINVSEYFLAEAQ